MVGNPTPVIEKLKFGMARDDRLGAMISHLKANPGVRDGISGGDVANPPWPCGWRGIRRRPAGDESIPTLRLATALMGLPQFWLTGRGQGGMSGWPPRPWSATFRSRSTPM